MLKAMIPPPLFATRQRRIAANRELAASLRRAQRIPKEVVG
jgi:hypothetical protein